MLSHRTGKHEGAAQPSAFDDCAAPFCFLREKRTALRNIVIDYNKILIEEVSRNVYDVRQIERDKTNVFINYA